MDRRLLTATIALLFSLPVSSHAQRPTAPPPAAARSAGGVRFAISFPKERSSAPLDGRLILMISADTSAEPRFQVNRERGLNSQLGFGIDVDAWAPGQEITVDGKVFGFPIRSLRDVPAGRYRVQAMMNRYETFKRKDGHVVKLPPDKGEGQHWNTKPGNLYSTVRWESIDPAKGGVVHLMLDQEIPPIADPPETMYVKHERIQSKLLTEFWGRPMYLGAHVLLPEGFDTHPDARYPVFINQGHFPYTINLRTEPADPNVKCEYSERFHLDCYNRASQEYQHQFYKDWTGPNFPRVLVIEIQHPTPYFDDSYAVNSANNGPYGDAIMKELLPVLEKKYRAIGQGWARFAYGGSTGGWESMAVQLFYPDEFNGVWAACPDPIDFRAYTTVNIYQDSNAYFFNSRWKRTPRGGVRDYLGHISSTLEEANLQELVQGTHSRSGDQWDIWDAVFSPVGADGYPQPIWDKITGKIDPTVAAYWREHYDLSYILRRDWKTLGPKVKGKLHIYVGDMDNYYLNNAVYLVEDFLKGTKDPAYDGEVDYGDRAEHCWNGDHTRPNAYSRLRYAQMFIPRAMDQIRKNHPAGADTLSWRY